MKPGTEIGLHAAIRDPADPDRCFLCSRRIQVSITHTWDGDDPSEHADDRAGEATS